MVPGCYGHCRRRPRIFGPKDAGKRVVNPGVSGWKEGAVGRGWTEPIVGDRRTRQVKFRENEAHLKNMYTRVYCIREAVWVWVLFNSRGP